ncbi:putative DNA-binding protein [Archangium gephyra]|uniref:DNA-binding protein n=1 Tax=Archangium gephyra TaxID=48 RepID=A0ABX9JTQ0_9BACT|nr:ATP-binding protein [Archangium gephyra]REG27000.1 putative DNA-binding protein [Archangium gephyra]
MALAYLHSPIRDAETTIQLVANQEIESMHLDFKEFFWTKNPNSNREPGQEAAKDIAAFANSEGGTIVVGVSDTNDRASGWNQRFKHEGKREQLEMWLRNYLTPSGLANHVEIIEITTAGGQETLVINVPPWPYGVVGIQGKDGGCLFPFRMGRDTRFLSIDEAMERNHVANRFLFLKIKKLMGDVPFNAELGGPIVRVVSPLVIKAEVGIIAVEEPVPLYNGGQGALVSLEEDSIRLAMVRYGGKYYAGERKLSFESLPPEGPGPFHVVTKHGSQLSVPFALISAAWRGAEEPRAIHLVIRGTVYWEQTHWALRTGEG